MWDRLIIYLSGLSRRERWLLALMIVVALPVAAIYGAVLPLNEARDAARARVAEARAIEVWVAGQAALYLAQGVTLGDTGAEKAAPIGISGIELSLVEAGLRHEVSELANSADGGITLRFDKVDFTDLTRWLTENERSWGYDVAAFSFTRGTRDDAVEADLKMVPAQ